MATETESRPKIRAATIGSRPGCPRYPADDASSPLADKPCPAPESPLSVVYPNREVQRRRKAEVPPSRGEPSRAIGERNSTRNPPVPVDRPRAAHNGLAAMSVYPWGVPQLGRGLGRAPLPSGRRECLLLVRVEVLLEWGAHLARACSKFGRESWPGGPQTCYPQPGSPGCGRSSYAIPKSQTSSGHWHANSTRNGILADDRRSSRVTHPVGGRFAARRRRAARCCKRCGVRRSSPGSRRRR